MAIVFDTAFPRLVGIDLPIVQAPIGGLARPALASAVSNAGALGMLAITWSEPEEIERTIAETRSLTDRPFGVNLILEWPQEGRLRQVLALGVRIGSTLHSLAFDGGWPEAPHRTLRNSTLDAWEAAGRPATDRPGEGDTIGVADREPILRYTSASPHDGVSGDAEPLSMWAGQSVGVIREVLPAAQIVAAIAAEASDALARASGLIRR